MNSTPRFLLGLGASAALIGSLAPSQLQAQTRIRPGGDRLDKKAPTRQVADITRSRKRPDKQDAPAPGEAPPSVEVTFPEEFRSLTGLGNNQENPAWGSIDQILLRRVPAAYEDLVGSPSGSDRPSARAVSNAICAQTDFTPNRRGATDYLWQWGQFLDHDIDETPTLDPAEAFDIPVPAGDPWFDPSGTGTQTIPLNRSYFEMIDGMRQQVNAITAYIDASNVYGSDEQRAYALRRLDGSGKLKTSNSNVGELLPYNDAAFDNAGGTSPALFLAGDVRANEQVALTAMHTLFVREHNQWAQEYSDRNPGVTDEEIYQFARMIVGAEMQAITYREFLPVLLGPDAIPPYDGYRPRTHPGISNLFATASYRLGHSLLSPTLLRLDADGSETAAGHLPLANAFFDPAHIEEEGIDSLLRGLASQTCQELDGHIVNDVRNFLFGPPGSGGFDLAALNMQRGRDHGLPSYPEVCQALGQRPPREFRDINPDPAVWQAMEEVYGSLDLIDCWVGGLCEPHLPGAMVGPMLHRVLSEQFIRLRDGDRFYYESHLPRELIDLVHHQTLANIIRRNTEIDAEIQANVFLERSQKAAPSPRQSPRPPRKR